MARYIDADKLLESGLRFRGGINDDGLLYVPFGDVLKSIKEMPTADVKEVKHAKWETREEKVYGIVPETFYVCPKCGTEYDMTFMAACCHDFEKDKTVFDYCPHCGARMDGKEKTNENQKGYKDNC